MIISNILSKPVGRILAVLLALACCWHIIVDAQAAVTIGQGYVEVNMVGGEEHGQMLLNGETPRGAGHYYTLSEQLYLNAPNGIASAVRVGVLMMHLTRTLPIAACLILICIVLINIARKRTFLGENVKPLLAAGIIIIAAAVLLPVINGKVIPAIVNAASDNNLGVGVTYAAPHFIYGLVLVLLAYVFKTGFNIKNANAPEESVCGL